MSRALTSAEIDDALTALPGVHRDRAGCLATALVAPTFADAVRLVTLVADEAEQMNHHPDVDLRWRTVTLTFSTHSVGGISQLDVELAHRALAAAQTVGAVTASPPPRVEIALDVTAEQYQDVARFWRIALGYVTVRTTKGSAVGDVELHDPTGRGPVLWFQPMSPDRPGRGRFHLDVYVDEQDVAGRLAELVDAGGVLMSDVHAPSWWVVADVAGNEVCLCTRAPHAGDLVD